ncbi:MAG: hypothetical protein F6K35_13535 [Okeania sp. SIO2H7]|nr:hypothetical protein [Okeania sp. SIO2H7]
MAKLSSEQRTIIWELKQRLLDILDEAKSTEFNLLNRFGETDRTIVALDQLTEIAEQAKERFSQLSTLQILIYESQPVATRDLLRLLNEKIAIIQNRVPALERSIEEIKTDWSLS